MKKEKKQRGIKKKGRKEEAAAPEAEENEEKKKMKKKEGGGEKKREIKGRWGKLMAASVFYISSHCRCVCVFPLECLPCVFSRRVKIQ